MHPNTVIHRHIDNIYQQQSRRVLATLVRLLGSFDLAEEALQDAFAAAVHQWPIEGIPDNPAAWLIKTGQRRGIDQLRKKQTARKHLLQLPPEESETPPTDANTIDDDQLRLIFTCCHPSLATEAQLALTLREMCGLTTEQVASALLQKPTTIAQRIVRAEFRPRDSAALKSDRCGNYPPKTEPRSNNMHYIDGFVAAVPTANKEKYLQHARDAVVVFKDHGALKMDVNPMPFDGKRLIYGGFEVILEE